MTLGAGDRNAPSGGYRGMVSNDTPNPQAPEPDPFQDLFRDLIEPSEPTTPAAAADAMPPTQAMPSPVTAQPPQEPTWMLPAADPVPQPPTTLPPTVVMPPAAEPQPAPAGPVLPQPAPTAVTTILPGGGSGEPPAGPPASGGGFRDWDPKKKALLWVLVGAAALLLLVLVVLAVALLTPRTPTPTPSPTSATHSPTPTTTRTTTPTPTPTPTPSVTTARIVGFQAAAATVQCADPTQGSATVQLTWNTADATVVAINYGSAQVDAIDDPSQTGLPQQQANFAAPFDCRNTVTVYTLTVAGTDGKHVSQSLTVTRTLPAAAPTVSSLTVDPVTVVCGTQTTASWVTTGDGVAVEVFRLNQAGGETSYVSVASGLSANGSLPVDIACLDGAPGTDFTIKIVATNPTGTAAAEASGTTQPDED